MSSVTADTTQMGRWNPSPPESPKTMPSRLWAASRKKKWAITSKTIKLIQNLFNIIIKSGGRIAKKSAPLLKRCITRLKLMSIVDLPPKILSLPIEFKKITKACQRHDCNKALLATMSFTLLIGSLFGMITSLVNATLETLHRDKIAWISKVALPLAATLVTLNFLSKSHSFYYLSAFNREFQRDLAKSSKDDSISDNELRKMLTPFLNKYLEVEETGDPDKNQLAKAAKIAALAKMTSKEIATELQDMDVLLNDKCPLEHEQLSQIKTILKSIDQSLTREMRIQRLSLVTATIGQIAIFLAFTPVTPLVPLSLSGISISLQIGLEIIDLYSGSYQHNDGELK